MVNIFDWYESFSLALENQRRRVRKDAESEVDDENEEKWRLHVQARFIRALHELDFLGFVKHTGRKADHIVRTVYESAE